MKYTGAKCAACGEEFTDTDDVVVCPECATPHHRKCYRINGECVNRIRHGTEFNWNTENRTAERTDDEFFNDKENKNPEEIKVERIEVETIPEFIENSLKIFDNDEKEKDGCTLREILDFVNRNVLYYMPVFARIRNMGSSISFNLICFIFPQAYFANRKMWFWALLTSFISVVLLIPMMITLLATDSPYASTYLPANVLEAISDNAGLINSLMEICNSADLIMRILFCLFGNRLYYNFAVRSVRKIKRQSGGDITKEQLVSAGGTKFVNIILIMLVTLALTFCTMLLLEFILPMIV